MPEFVGFMMLIEHMYDEVLRQVKHKIISQFMPLLCFKFFRGFSSHIGFYFNFSQ